MPQSCDHCVLPTPCPAASHGCPDLSECRIGREEVALCGTGGATREKEANSVMPGLGEEFP
jgi:hypothetical protein